MLGYSIALQSIAQYSTAYRILFKIMTFFGGDPVIFKTLGSEEREGGEGGSFQDLNSLP